VKGSHVAVIAAACVVALALLGCGQKDASGVYQQAQSSSSGTSTVEVQLQDSGEWRWTEAASEDEQASPKVVDEGTYTVEGNIVRALGRWGEYRWVLDDDTLESPEFTLIRTE
jgi:hypothetical protein